MIDFANRSSEKELLDNDQIPFADIRQNMQELNIVNKHLGGHAITIDGIKKIITANGGTQVLSICEIGCGGGDNLFVVSEWCKKNKISATFTGIDIKHECIQFAREQYQNLEAKWICSDYANHTFEIKPDIIFSSLFCHHFSDQEVVKILKWKRNNSRLGFFINDLERNKIAYYSIATLTKIFSRSYLVKNDAPLSVARSFKKSEWLRLFQSAGISNFSVEWKWAFRYLITCKTR